MKKVVVILRNKVVGNPRPCSSCGREIELYVSICVPGTHINLCEECAENVQYEIEKEVRSIRCNKW